MADYIVNKGIQGRPSVNLQSTSLVGPQGPQGPQGTPGLYWTPNNVGIYTTGFVGIGTTNRSDPSLNLEVIGNVNINGVSNFNGYVYFNALSFAQDINAIGYFSVGVGNPVAITSTGNISAIGNIICDGHIGIGTTNPTAKLDVRGDIKSGIDTSTGLVLTSPNGTEYRLIVDDSGNLTTVSI